LSICKNTYKALSSKLSSKAKSQYGDAKTVTATTILENQPYPQGEMELNIKNGKRLVWIAWAIELTAASIGLFIGITTAIASIDYYNSLEGAGALTGNTFSNVFVGAAPFIIIAAVELTKIPLVLGFYRVKSFVWRCLFVATLMLLIFVTFETLFNGLERQFSATESKISIPKRALQVERANSADLEKRLNEVNTRTVEDIEQDYLNKINQELDDRKQALDSARNQKEKETAVIRNQLTSLTEQSINVSDIGGLNSRLDRARGDLDKLEARYSAANKDLRTSRENLFSDHGIQLQQLESEENEAVGNKGLFASESGIREGFKEKRLQLVLAKNQTLGAIEQEISDLESTYRADRDKIGEQITAAENNLSSSQSYQSGSLQNNFDQLNKQIERINSSFSVSQDDIVSRSDLRIENLNSQKEAIVNLQKQRELELPNIENAILDSRSRIVSTEESINAAAQGNNIYRMTQKIYGHEKASLVKEEELRVVMFVWFGTIAFIAATVGSVIALAGFIMQDPQSFKGHSTSIRSVLADLIRAISSHYRNRRVGLIRSSFRRLIVDMRKYLRSPRVRFKEIKVREIVEKPVPGPERIVYKEVPKEIVRKELVYVPVYHSMDAKNIAEVQTLASKEEEETT
jgi:hypothetical protein